MTKVGSIQGESGCRLVGEGLQLGASTARGQNYLGTVWEKEEEGRAGRQRQFSELPILLRLRMVTDLRGCFLGEIGGFFGKKMCAPWDRERRGCYTWGIQYRVNANSWRHPRSITFLKERYPLSLSAPIWARLGSEVHTRGSVEAGSNTAGLLASCFPQVIASLMSGAIIWQDIL